MLDDLGNSEDNEVKNTDDNYKRKKDYVVHKFLFEVVPQVGLAPTTRRYKLRFYYMKLQRRVCMRFLSLLFRLTQCP